MTKTNIDADATRPADYRVTRKRLSALRPSPENSLLYATVDPDDPEIAKLADSIGRHGLREPLVVTCDGFIVSGHRRFAALSRVGQQVVPCRVLPRRRSEMSQDEFLVLLREHNRSRDKSVAERVREELVNADIDGAYRRLQQRRCAERSRPLTCEVIESGHARHGISAQKADHVRFILQVVNEDRREYWPLSVRAVHYALLNHTFLRNIPRQLPYRNDQESYQATSDLITRMRLNGDLPWQAFADPTRPVKTFNAFSDVRQFVRQELDHLFDGYWRNLQQSQPRHIECVVEKNTIYPLALRVTKEYQINTTSIRGFSSVDTLYDLAGRYRAADKNQLAVIVLSDFDPEGERIVHTVGDTLISDFGIPTEEVAVVKAGVTREQITRYGLPQQNFAKEQSANYEWFVTRNGGDTAVYELEALQPQSLLGDLDQAIRGVLDVDLFNAEVAIEKQEAAFLDVARNQAIQALQGLDWTRDGSMD